MLKTERVIKCIKLGFNKQNTLKRILMRKKYCTLCAYSYQLPFKEFCLLSFKRSIILGTCVTDFQIIICIK